MVKSVDLTVRCPWAVDDSLATGGDMWIVAALVGCGGSGNGPLGIPLDLDGITYAGVASIDVTPLVTESWTDVNGDGEFGGCFDDPGCDEPFDDADGDGEFDAVFIGGYGPLRPATGVHDPVYARALVVSRDGEYVAMVALDFVGLGHPRIWQARDRLAALGFDPDRLLVSSSHNHQGPDTVGLWGDPFLGRTGVDWAYQEQITDAIEEAVHEAAAAMVPVDLTIGRVAMRDRSPFLNGANFSGKNPQAITHGMIYDRRDPVVVSDQLLVLHGVAQAGPLFTLTNWSGHPEVWGDENTEISSDWVGVTRAVLEAELGGIALHLPESLGGMQSALGADLPLILEDGTHLYQVCDDGSVADPDDVDCFGLSAGDPRIDADGDAVPVWSERNSWEYVNSHGWLIAEAALDALEQGEPLVPDPIRVEREPFVLPIENLAYNLLGPQGLFDMDIDEVLTDLERCPEAGTASVIGCFEPHVFRVQLGDLSLLSVPGELLPELAWGLPSDAAWAAEDGDPAARGAGAIYFPQHDADCQDEIDAYEECTDRLVQGECDCTQIHAWPYTLSPDPTHVPLLDLVDTEYRAIIGMTDSYFGYVVPEPDFHFAVSLLTDDGDHYEDTVSPAHMFGTRILEAHHRIDGRW